MTRPLQTLGVLLLGGLAVGLPWLTGVTAGAAWLSAHRAIVETPLTTLAVAAFGLTGAAVALAEPWLGAFVVWAGLSLFRIGWPGMPEAVLPTAPGGAGIRGGPRAARRSSSPGGGGRGASSGGGVCAGRLRWRGPPAVSRGAAGSS